MATGGAAPLTDAEADALFAPLQRFARLVVAVSGGSDSTALLHLAQAWAGRSGRDPRTLLAVTVDHRLRRESAAEAAEVERQAQMLGVGHRTIPWLGDKPATGIQAAARAARARLLAGVAADLARDVDGPVAIVTAHTADDQAETVLMRLARGSGVDGLAAIPPEGVAHAADEPEPQPEPGKAFAVLRPLLGVSRARLAATLEASGFSFADDPSNRDPRFERVRVRQALPVLEGLGMTREAFARTAVRMQAAREVLEQAADALESRAVTVVLDLVHEIEFEAFSCAPRDTAVRVLRRTLATAGGSAPPAELGAVEEVARRIATGAPARTTATLGGCVIETAPPGSQRPALIRIYREPKRDGGLPRRVVEPGACLLWDARFWAEVQARQPASAEVGPLGEDWPQIAAAHQVLHSLPIPAGAICGLPVFRRDGAVIAAPILAAFALRAGDHGAAAALAGPVWAGSTAPGDIGNADLRTRPRHRGARESDD